MENIKVSFLFTVIEKARHLRLGRRKDFTVRMDRIRNLYNLLKRFATVVWLQWRHTTEGITYGYLLLPS